MGLFQNCAVVVAAVCIAVQWYQRRRHRSIKDLQGPPSSWLLGQVPTVLEWSGTLIEISQVMNWTSGGRTSWVRPILSGWLSTGAPGVWEDASGYEPIPSARSSCSFCAMVPDYLDGFH